MAEYYLAVDIGASSGRHILGHVEEGKIVLEEVYRFPNEMKKKDGHLCWDLPGLFSQIKEGMKACRAAGKIPVSMGVDTWGVDYVLLDGQGHVLGKTYGYRDHRTTGMDREVYRIVPEEELYARTGIQKQIFNTVYQLMAVLKQEPENMERAERLLMLPDYFHFLLTGNQVSEYTDATSSQLVSPETKQWDRELIGRLGYKDSIFGKLCLPGSKVGALKKDVEEEVGFSCRVVLPATHDTASAVISVPVISGDCLYISSGTWSLMGTEVDRAICTPESRAHNFTNEGGYGYRFRYLKNIMGLWMIQSVRRELMEKGEDLSFARLCLLAEESGFSARVDVNDDAFLAPESMTEAIRACCRKTRQREPRTPGELAAVVYGSLAECYGQTAREIETLTGKHFEAIHIVGGGSNAAYLNRLTARESGKTVYAGPGEATAIGNLAVQMLEEGRFDSLEAVRSCIYDSFGVEKFESERKA